MNVVQTAFLGSERIQSLVPLAVVKAMYPEMSLDRRPLAQGAGLILAWRMPRPEDWVDGEFVGDHAEPDEPHAHGAP